jgi:hypothetical protein
MPLTRRTLIATALAFFATPALAQRKFRRFKRVQYIAALGLENETSGTGAETWGLWRVDPGPIGVWLKFYKLLAKAGNIAPSGWRFDINDWWIDENGLIMKAPEFPMPAGQYYVTNGEEHISLLTVDAPDANGAQTWNLSDDKRIKDVTHGPCRSSRYTPEFDGAVCSPTNADISKFPLRPGESPPPVADCTKKDYAVLIVFGVPVAG